MDEICKSLSDKISSAGKGGFCVFYEDELLEAIADESERNRDVLEAALKKLRSGGYIDVRYARGNAFCIAALKPYEAEPAKAPEAPAKKRPAVDRVYLFLAALTGGALGGAIGALIAAFAF